ncbi:serine/threonine-protein kinase (plasmid) [Streptomyces sp. BHT-5-2]|uniref:serine/threonine-protein kinase n=1 Tax=unclassified Streptomyces TaxID=2593676 RepID=UPI001C8E9525|nr:serine/threonine-protein kinase [Streptomyces sp. BHT-5-2]QZL07817.1 serine/threonine-protein kinase [Streptomyces sp. BHT-5-2]
MKPLGQGDPLRLGPYRLHGVLGEGGMGKVYFGADAAGRPAAVKVLLPELAHDGHLADRFLREARTAQAVTSQGVAHVLAAELEGGRPWIATEFLAGPTLDDAVTRFGPLGDAAVRELARSLARTLQDVHTTGLVHRDVKPPNVVLTSRGPRLIDFGIARPEHGLTLTRTGQIPVTPGYGAPEQVLGRRVGPAADVFSLGAVLAFAAGGRPAYTGAEITAVLYEVVHGEPDLGAVPEALRHLLIPCFAKDPAARPLPGQVAEAAAAPGRPEKLWKSGPLGDEIRQREAAARRLTTRPTGPTPTTGSGAAGGGPGLTRRRLVAAAGGGALLAAAGGGTVWWLARDDAPADPFDIPPAAQVRIAPLGSADGTPKPLWGPVQDIADAGSPAPLPVRDVVVFAASGGGIAAREVTDGRERWRVGDAKAGAGYLSIGDRLVATADGEGTLRTWVAATGSPRWTVDAQVGALLAADAHAVYLLTTDGRLRCVGTDGRVRWTQPPPLPLSGGHPVAALGAGHLVFCTETGDVAAVRAQDGARAWVRKGQAAGALRPAVDGGTVYLGGNTLAAVEVVGGRQRWALDPMRPPRRGTAGWGPPAVAGGVVYALDCDALRSVRTDGSQAVNPMMIAGVAPPWQPPVVQGGGVWIVESEDTGVSGLPRSGEGRPQTYALSGGRPRSIAADGNRLFVLNHATLLALPVY